MKILFVGLSNKPGLEPFSAKTNSGKIVDKIIGSLDHECYKINLVGYAPMGENNKLRYPTKAEIKDSLPNFLGYVDNLSPDLIVSFGGIASDTIKKINVLNCKVIYKQHPSYIYVYKRNYVDEYAREIVIDINKYLYI